MVILAAGGLWKLQDLLWTCPATCLPTQNALHMPQVRESSYQLAHLSYFVIFNCLSWHHSNHLYLDWPLHSLKPFCFADFFFFEIPSKAVWTFIFQMRKLKLRKENDLPRPQSQWVPDTHLTTSLQWSKSFCLLNCQSNHKNHPDQEHRAQEPETEMRTEGFDESHEALKVVKPLTTARGNH